MSDGLAIDSADNLFVGGSHLKTEPGGTFLRLLRAGYEPPLPPDHRCSYGFPAPRTNSDIHTDKRLRPRLSCKLDQALLSPDLS